MAAQSFRSDAGHQLNCRYVHVDDEWGINPVKSGFSLTFLNTKHHGNRLNVKEKMNDMSFGIQFPLKRVQRELSALYLLRLVLDGLYTN